MIYPLLTPDLADVRARDRDPRTAGGDATLSCPLPLSRVVMLFVLFFAISLGLGYPVLNRFNPQSLPGLADTQVYAAMVTGASPVSAGHMRFRVLVPVVARPFYRLARNRFGSWDPVFFGLLVSDSLFTAATAILIVLIAVRSLGSYPVGLLGAFLYLLNFAVPNMRLAGLVDAGEGFFLLALFWALCNSAFWVLPLIAVLGAAAKESFVPYAIVFLATWWIWQRRSLSRTTTLTLAFTALLAPLALALLQRHIRGSFVSPWQFGGALRSSGPSLARLGSALADRNLWYVFAWLLPASLPRLRLVSPAWRAATAATAVTACALDVYYGGAPGTLGRALFTVAGPLLSLSAAAFLLQFDIPSYAVPEPNRPRSPR